MKREYVILSFEDAPQDGVGADKPIMTLERFEKLQRVGPSLGDPGYVPYCGCNGLYRARRGPTGFECTFNRCGVGRTVNGVDMFDQTAPDGSGFEWTDDALRARTQSKDTPQ